MSVSLELILKHVPLGLPRNIFWNNFVIKERIEVLDLGDSSKYLIRVGKDLVKVLND